MDASVVKDELNNMYFAYDWTVVKINGEDALEHSDYYIDDKSKSDLSKKEVKKEKRMFVIPIPVSRNSLSSR